MRSRKHLPHPPHPVTRQQPLPGDTPLTPEGNPETASQQRTIMANPSYRVPDHDISFIHGPDTVAVRLQLDYLKAELALREANIRHAVVVFGSTRLREPAVALKELEQAEAHLKLHTDDLQAQSALKAAQQKMELSRYYEVGRELGRRVAEASQQQGENCLVVMTGGGPGAMESANRGAAEAGGRTVGLNITLPHEQYPNPFVTPGLCFQFHYFAMRKLHFLHRAVALVALPGGFGTLDELSDALTLVQTRKIAPMPIVLVGETWWRQALNMDFLLESGMIDPEDLDLFWYAESAEEAWDSIVAWHHDNGSDIFDGNPGAGYL
jgi:uncharacterized protein (TIGR00730 family)